MNRALTHRSLALAAGLLGGTLSRYVTPTTVLAQTQSTAPKQIRAQHFILVNEDGIVLGVFAVDSSVTIHGFKQKGSNAPIGSFDDSGREVFRADLLQIG